MGIKNPDVCGDLIGEGVHRYVYQHKFDRTKVVKVPKNANHIDKNKAAWDTYNLLVQYGFYRWVPPVYRVSEDFIILVQRKVTPIRNTTHSKPHPDNVPTFFIDKDKNENWGVLGGSVVFIDLGNPYMPGKIEREVFYEKNQNLKFLGG